MLFPIIIPRSYNDSGLWPGPIRHLRHPELAVTWVELHPAGTMTYLNWSTEKGYRSLGKDYEAEALENLREASKGQLYTHEKNGASGFEFVAAMHPDGLGTSRLLLLAEWSELFPHGFEFGIPERSVAVVVPLGLSASEREDALQIINGCHERGTTSMLPGLHEPALFALKNG